MLAKNYTDFNVNGPNKSYCVLFFRKYYKFPEYST